MKSALLRSRGRHWLGVSVIAAVVVAAGVFSVSQFTSASFADSAPHTGNSGADGTFLLDCEHNAVSKPNSFAVTCGNGTYTLSDLRWKSWGGATATATATYFEKDCTPDCAGAMLLGYPVNVTANSIHSIGTVARYERLTLSFDGAQPAWLDATHTISFDVSNSERAQTGDGSAADSSTQ